MRSAIDLSSAEYQLIVRFGQAIHGTLDLHVALDQALPFLERLVSVDHIALAVSRPGTRHDYEWFNNTLPEKYLGAYPEIADHDFVRAAVAEKPNQVMRDHQMISRQKLRRHVLYTRARDTGANLEHVMAVMLSYEQDWSSGLSLYRTRNTPFSDREAAILELLVPSLVNAVRNNREYDERTREALLEPVIAHAGFAVLWLDARLREVNRTPQASALIERFFAANERKSGTAPEAMLRPLREYFADRTQLRQPPEATRDGELDQLRMRYVPLPDRGLWAVVLSTRGLSPGLGLGSELPPALRKIAARLLRGHSNQRIADDNNTKLSTVKQQVSDIYRRLGVKGRKGLIQLASGLEPTDQAPD